MEKIQGIYIIQSKTKPERVYVGSAKSIYHRWNEHKRELRQKIHHSIKLRRHYDKYGLDDLDFVILEQINTLSKEYLLEREQYYLDTYKPYFNIYTKAGSPLGHTHSQETKDKWFLS